MAAVMSPCSISSSLQPRPSAAPGIGWVSSPSSRATCRAAPSAVPLSPAAGWTQTCSKGVSARMRVLGTQFRGVPPGGQGNQPLLEPLLDARGEVGVRLGPLLALAQPRRELGVVDLLGAEA